MKKHVALLLILLLALLLRIYGIQWGLPGEGHTYYSYHPDENFAVFWAKELYKGHILNKQFQYGGTLYSSFIYACIKTSEMLSGILPGYNAFGRSIIFTRAVLVVVALLSIFLMYRIGEKLFSRTAGLLAALMLAVTPAHVIWAQRVRVDELATLAALVIFYLSVPIFQQRSTSLRFWVFVGISVGVASALRAPLLLFGVAPVIGYLITRSDISTLYSRPFLKAIVVYGLAIVSAYAVSSPHSFIYFDTFIEGLQVEKGYQSTVFMDAYGLGPVWWQFQRYMLPQALGWPIYLLLIVAVIWVIRFREQRALLIALSMLPYLLLTAFGTWVVVRYTIPMLPYLILLCIAFLHYLRSIAQYEKTVLPAVAAISILTLSFLLPYQSLNTKKNIREEIHDWMAEKIPPKATVLTLRGYQNDVFFEPVIPTENKHVFAYVPLMQECSACYRAWNYDYIVVSDPLLKNWLRLRAEYPSAEIVGFFDWIGKTHELIGEFEISPNWFGIDIKGMYSAHDLGYINPSHKIYRKIKS